MRPDSRSIRWVLIIPLIVGSFGLLLWLPYPYGNLMMGIMVVGSAGLAAYPAVASRYRQLVAQNWQPVWAVAAVLLSPLAQIIQPLGGFYQGDIHQVKSLRWSDLAASGLAVTFSIGLGLTLLVLPQSTLL